jgi:NADPH2:quinone reductase
MGMTALLAPSEPLEVWRGLRQMWESGLLKPTVYEKEYYGLESVREAMQDLYERRVWGKAVVLLHSDDGTLEEEAKL